MWNLSKMAGNLRVQGKILRGSLTNLRVLPNNLLISELIPSLTILYQPITRYKLHFYRVRAYTSIISRRQHEKTRPSLPPNSKGRASYIIAYLHLLKKSVIILLIDRFIYFVVSFFHIIVPLFIAVFHRFVPEFIPLINDVLPHVIVSIHNK